MSTGTLKWQASFDHQSLQSGPFGKTRKVSYVGDASILGKPIILNTYATWYCDMYASSTSSSGKWRVYNFYVARKLKPGSTEGDDDQTSADEADWGICFWDDDNPKTQTMKPYDNGNVSNRYDTISDDEPIWHDYVFLNRQLYVWFKANTSLNATSWVQSIRLQVKYRLPQLKWENRQFSVEQIGGKLHFKLAEAAKGEDGDGLVTYTLHQCNATGDNPYSQTFYDTEFDYWPQNPITYNRYWIDAHYSGLTSERSATIEVSYRSPEIYWPEPHWIHFDEYGEEDREHMKVSWKRAYGLYGSEDKSIMEYGDVLFMYPAYDPEKTYKYGDVVRLGNTKRYMCISDIATPESFNAAHWSQQSVYTAGDLVLYGDKAYQYASADMKELDPDFNTNQWLCIDFTAQHDWYYGDYTYYEGRLYKFKYNHVGDYGFNENECTMMPYIQYYLYKSKTNKAQSRNPQGDTYYTFKADADRPEDDYYYFLKMDYITEDSQMLLSSTYVMPNEQWVLYQSNDLVKVFHEGRWQDAVVYVYHDNGNGSPWKVCRISAWDDGEFKRCSH